MNPLLFADWRRMNRLFTRSMWALAAVLICVVCVALASRGSASRSPSSAARAGVVSPESSSAAASMVPGSGSTR